MSKEMICPVCKKAKLVRFFNPLTGKYHEDYDCPYRLCNFRGNEVAVNALIQSQRDLQIAKQALEGIRDETGEDRAGFSYVVLAINMKETAEKALAQITHDNKGGK